MSNLECHSCKQSIDGDSLFCDQCGAQIFICSVCGRTGKGKRCIYDGKEMILPQGAAAQPGNAPAAQLPAGSSSVTSHISSQAVPVSAAAPSIQTTVSQTVTSNKIKLTAQNLGIVIEANDGDVLGRTKGTFASVLGRFSHISGTHCQVLKINGEWNIKDLGSTNGTFMNGAKINPNTAIPLNNGAKVKLADIEFLISVEAAEAGTQRI